MQIIYPDLNEQKKPQKPTPYSTDSQSVLHYWVRQEKGAWLNEKAWNPVLPKCSFVASVYFFFSTTPQTKICLLCVLKCATKIHMQHCPHYYSFLSWRWRQKLFFFFLMAKNSNILLSLTGLLHKPMLWAYGNVSKVSHMIYIKL